MPRFETTPRPLLQIQQAAKYDAARTAPLGLAAKYDFTSGAPPPKFEQQQAPEAAGSAH